MFVESIMEERRQRLLKEGRQKGEQHILEQVERIIEQRPLTKDDLQKLKGQDS